MLLFTLYKKQIQTLTLKPNNVLVAFLLTLGGSEGRTGPRRAPAGPEPLLLQEKRSNQGRVASPPSGKTRTRGTFSGQYKSNGTGNFEHQKNPTLDMLKKKKHNRERNKFCFQHLTYLTFFFPELIKICPIMLAGVKHTELLKYFFTYI